MAGKLKTRLKETAVATATLRKARISPQKARLILDLIRGRQVEPAMQILQHSPKKAARLILPLLKSALVNAREQKNADVDKLWVTEAWADMGVSLRRYLPRAQGRATPIDKASAHITVVLGER